MPQAARAPLQVVASALAREHELLDQLAVTMLRMGAQGDTKAAAWVLRAFPEGFGRIGESDAGQQAEEERLPTLEEIRLMRAELDAGDAPSSES